MRLKMMLEFIILFNIWLFIKLSFRLIKILKEKEGI